MPARAVTSVAANADLGQPEAEVPMETGESALSVRSTFGATPLAVGLQPIQPTRLVDTRFNQGALAPGTVLVVPVAGQGRVPASGVLAVVVNLTVTEPAAVGFATVYPCGAPPPDVSSLNYAAGQTVANVVTVTAGEGGAVCVVTTTPAQLIVDVTGYYAAGGSGFAPVAPARLFDSRTAGAKPVAAGTVLIIPVAGSGGVPSTGVTAASLNVTATSAAAVGFVTVFPCGGETPNASNLNLVAGGTVANGVVTATDAAGAVCVVSSVATHLIVDMNGWFGSAALGSFTAIPPVRIMDTRTTTRLVANTTLEVPVGSQSAVALNVTIAEPVASGFVTVWPCGLTKPNASSINFAKGQTIANAVNIGVGIAGKVCVVSTVATQVIVDHNGEFRVASGDSTLTGPAAFAIQWAYTQIGDKYASINPYRFGDSIYGKAWDCPDGQPVCSRVDMGGKLRTASVGSYVYDCSGLVVASWLRGGVDLVKKNAAWSDVMFKNLPHVAREQVQPGDLLLFSYGAGSAEDPTDHVAIYLNDKEMLHSGSCVNYSGVCVRTIDWTSVVAIARVPQG
jgi:cell wall-associated NlpC family hydrolase